MKKQVFKIEFVNSDGKTNVFGNIESRTRLKEVIAFRKLKGYRVKSIIKEVIEYLPIY